MKPEYSSQTEVLKILRRRIYHGKAHDNKLDNLKAAEREILDYIDALFSSETQRKLLENDIDAELAKAKDGGRSSNA